MFMTTPSMYLRYLSLIVWRHATVDANVHAKPSLAPGGRLAVVYSFAAFQEGMQPSQHSGPASVALGDFGISGETAVANSDKRPLVRRFQLPSDRRFHIARPRCSP